MKVASLFSGCGGLDLGFTRAGFDIAYANDNDPIVWETFEKNHNTKIDTRSLFDVKPQDIPDVDGIIGCPPCQSWRPSNALENGRGGDPEGSPSFGK